MITFIACIFQDPIRLFTRYNTNENMVKTLDITTIEQAHKIYGRNSEKLLLARNVVISLMLLIFMCGG